MFGFTQYFTWGNVLDPWLEIKNIKLKLIGWPITLSFISKNREHAVSVEPETGRWTCGWPRTGGLTHRG